LSKYGNATGSVFDLTDETNLSGIEGEDAQVSGEGINNSAMPENRTTSNVTTSTIIVDEAAYQTAQYIANNTVLHYSTTCSNPLPLQAPPAQMARQPSILTTLRLHNNNNNNN
jgi:hypothetical protein